MRGLEHTELAELLLGLSPLISGSVYLNRCLGSSREPVEDEEAREMDHVRARRASRYVFTCSCREITAALLSPPLSLSLSIRLEIRAREVSREREKGIKGEIEEDRGRSVLLLRHVCARFRSPRSRY